MTAPKAANGIMSDDERRGYLSANYDVRMEVCRRAVKHPLGSPVREEMMSLHRWLVALEANHEAVREMEGIGS